MKTLLCWLLKLNLCDSAGYPEAIFESKLMAPFLDFLGRLPKDLPIIGSQEDQSRWLSLIHTDISSASVKKMLIICTIVIR